MPSEWKLIVWQGRAAANSKHQHQHHLSPQATLSKTSPPCALLILSLPFPSLPSPLLHACLFFHSMKDMNSRFKTYLGSKRNKPSNPITNSSSPNNTSNASSPPPQTSGSSLSPPSIANSSTTSLPQNQQPPMNPQNPLGRPPSYTYAPPGGGNLGAPPGHGRPTSPMPPPPINTGAAGGQYAPQQQMYGHPPPAAGPPGYPPQPPAGQYPPGGGYGAPAPQGPQSYQRPGAVEVEGAGRSKAQLIVGIDFVGCFGLYGRRSGRLTDY